MIEHIGGAPQRSNGSPLAFLKTVLILRLGAGTLLFTLHGWRPALDAYHFLWEETPWNWVPAFDAAGMPIPHLLAPAAALVIAAVGISWILGFLTRFFSALLIPICIASFGMVRQFEPAAVESVYLYLLVAITLMLFGSGAVSLDGLFRLGARGSKKSSGY
jgi:uncharacterized membrane protein YphA (DoxX/SURF4 family)